MPYKSSGGEMVWNVKLKRNIPKDWCDCRLIDISNITMGQSPDGSSYNEVGDGIIFYQGSSDFGTRFPKIRQYTTSPTRFAKEGDILMSVRAPVGALNIANNNCCIGRGLAALNSKDGSNTYLYCVLIDLKKAFDQRNKTGTTFGSITKDDLYNLTVLRPSEECIKCFENICKSIFDQQMKIGEHLLELQQLRDELLPMLLNGQVSVGKNNEYDLKPVDLQLAAEPGDEVNCDLLQQLISCSFIFLVNLRLNHQKVVNLHY